MVFLCDTGDLFNPRVSRFDLFRVLDVLYERDDVDWQILTKRACRMCTSMLAWLRARHLEQVPPWMWLMVSAENQKWYDRRTRWLMRTPAAVRGVSLEPLLGAVNVDLVGLDGALQWMIVGGESGPGARPMELAWVRAVRDECAMDGRVAFFFKQWGDNPGDSAFGTPWTNAVRARHGGRLLDDRQWDEFPVSISTAN
jgi:protein gp37